MKWTFWKTFLLGWLLPFISVAVPLWVMYLKQRHAAKKLKSQLNIDTFNSILEESKELREEFKKERNFLKNELDKERGIVKDMADKVIELTSRNEQILFQNKILIQHLKNVLGIKGVIDIRTIKISVLEDDAGDTELMQRLFKKNNIENASFYKDRELFIKNIDSDVRIIIIDQNLQGQVKGLDVIKELIDLNEYRYFIMLSGMRDFNIIYNFKKMVLHGTYILKGSPDADILLIKSIKHSIHYLSILSDVYNDVEKLYI